MKDILLPYKSLTSDTQRFEISVGQEFFDALSGTELLSGDLKLVVLAQKISAGVKLDVNLKGEVCVECDRCLESCPINIEFEGKLTAREGETSEEYDEDTMWISAADSEIDLTQYIYESIVLALPYQRVHGQDENGNLLCDSEMLSKFNIVSDDEFERIIANKQDKESDPEWSKLKELKEKLNK
ncbi:MAG: YceD family protein [Rikenellaceae bacterium]